MPNCSRSDVYSAPSLSAERAAPVSRVQSAAVVRRAIESRISRPDASEPPRSRSAPTRTSESVTMASGFAGPSWRSSCTSAASTRNTPTPPSVRLAGMRTRSARSPEGTQALVPLIDQPSPDCDAVVLGALIPSATRSPTNSAVAAEAMSVPSAMRDSHVAFCSLVPKRSIVSATETRVSTTGM